MSTTTAEEWAAEFISDLSLHVLDSDAAELAALRRKADCVPALVEACKAFAERGERWWKFGIEPGRTGRDKDYPQLLDAAIAALAAASSPPAGAVD